MGGIPVVWAGGMTGDTKPQGGAILPSRSNRGKVYYLPGGMNFAQDGWADLRKVGGLKLSNGETLTGQTSSTNVNEGSVLGVNVSYGGYPPRVEDYTGYKKVFIEKATITSAAAVTWNSGVTAIDTASTDATWLDTSANYHLLGVVGNIGAATFGGLLNVTGLGGAWAGYMPSIPLNNLSAVTFDTGQALTLAPSPIPFSGANPCSLGMTAASSGAIAFGIVIGEL
jgi:hypothetical protein